ncbi:Core-2/I-branching beta-1,6-N-acetylglucosaminyltransferase family protein [Quillaja saponaria]|uniref:Core-2/I-branching beta-1,6-N-acetylglucosaminyltransferase family protein n=1 Tax=Quillaja saponaria TaxID=32244 RepID=A0AAD7QGT1_QUISA|nr:Core-2/I-branching beta-1,6-N-acetylglucosaminyltransferase family protein [Quillaja saponaria]
MVQAERLLIEEALRDPGNQRFILLSDSCVPLYNFSYIYNYVMSSPESFVDSFSNPKDGRYNPKMSPVIPKEKWRKGSQWITLIRRHATIVVDDDIVFPVFEKYCKSWAAIGLRKGRKILQGIDIKFPIQMPRLLKHGNCIPDEHYVQTLLEMSGAENELERRTLTYTSWDQSAVRGTRKSWHPVTLTYSDVTPEQVAKIKDINQVYYKSERRTEWCQANSKFTSCFLFARKFTTGAAVRLLTEGFIGPFNVYSSQS